MNRQEAIVKAKALLAQMTTEEKVAQMVQVPYAQAGREEALRWARLGAGSFLHVLGDDAREIQRAAMSTRLGIPVIFGIDAIHGHGLNRNATIFPSQLATACAWDPEAARTMGEVTAREVATDGLHWTFSPVLCLARDTRWGRVDETFGEDPYLAGELGAAIVRGYQGDDLADGEHILACAKHYLAYGEAVGARDACDSEVTERKIREVFLPPFRKAVEAGCATIMTAYGAIDGTPLTVNRRMLTEILREELGFQGFVVTDWDNARSLVRLQHVYEGLAEASVAAAEAGNDMIMTTLEFYDAMLDALRSGTGDMAAVDSAVLHILTIKYEMGLFDAPEKTGKPGCIGCESHRQAALDAARKSVTLLKNDGMLPLGPAVKRIALLGPTADDIRAQYGDWTYFTHPIPGVDVPAQRPYVTLKEGLEALCRERGVTLRYAKGCGLRAEDTDDLEACAGLIRESDAVILAVGDDRTMHGEYTDRADLRLTGRQAELAELALRLGKPVCLVLIASKPLCLEKAAESNAVICAFNGGMYGGQAVAEAIFGDLNPGGRLPISFPHHSGQVPVYYNQLPGWHGEKYWDLPKDPLYTFGEGLSYTTFRYSGLQLDPETFTLRVKVANTGAREGTETVQLYFRDLVSSVMTPVKRLMGFRKVTLAPGEEREVAFALKAEDFALVNARCETVTEPGSFRLMCGHSAKDEDLLNLTFRLEADGSVRAE